MNHVATTAAALGCEDCRIRKVLRYVRRRGHRTLADGVIAVGLLVGVAPIAVAHAVEEDQPGWSCVDDGNKVCGPGNDEGKPAGRYDEGGVLVDPWPVN
jgi:hypothetical protein